MRKAIEKGLRIVRFRERYFIYRNFDDSCPDVLGRRVVNDIPSDAKWLQVQRQEYERLTEKLEKEILTITTQRMQDIMRPVVSAPRLSSYSGYRWSLCGQMNEGLDTLPTAFGQIFDDGYRKWIYLIDLDEELFVINNRIFFDLGTIPRDTWISAFTCEPYREITFSFEGCPEAFDKPRLPQYLATVSEKHELSEAYQGYKVELVTASIGQALCPRTSPKDMIALLTFAELVDQYDKHFHEVIPRCAHGSFVVRELVFAIISLASGRFRFDNIDRFSAHWQSDVSDGALVDMHTGQQPLPMPIFGSGCHAADQEPGSAPAEDIFWVEDVLVSLVPDAVFEDGIDSAVAKAIESRTYQTRQSFEAVLCSGVRVIYLDVNFQNGITRVRRTEPIALFDLPERDGVWYFGKRDSELSPFAELAQYHRGFQTLQHFFHIAAMRKLAGFGQGTLPVEIYARIIAYVDSPTYAACKRVSRNFLALCQDRFDFGPEHELLRLQDTEGFTCREEVHECRQRRGMLDKFGSFTFREKSTGTVVQSGLEGQERTRDNVETTWCPIIGPINRPSMIAAVTFLLVLTYG